MTKFEKKLAFGIVVLFAIAGVFLGMGVYALKHSGGLRCVVMTVWEGSPPQGCPR